MDRSLNGGGVRAGAGRLRGAFVCALALSGAALLVLISSGADVALLAPDAAYSHHQILPDHQAYTIHTEGCSIPGLTPFDHAVKEFVEYPHKISKCVKGSNILQNNNTHIWLNPNITNSSSHNNFTVHGKVICCYSAFYRPNSVKDITSLEIDQRVAYHNCIYFSDIIVVNDEFVRVVCIDERKKDFDHFFLFAPKKKFVPYVPTYSKKSTASNSGSATAPKYNVIIMGIDAVSRLNFHRTMPKTVEYMKNMGAVELLGYNKVADNTFPNVIPMLLGIKVSELRTTCLPRELMTFDNCPFVWEWFKQAGYYTALAEDSSILGTFNFLRAGFSGTPTDYYLHTFIKEAESNIGNNQDFNSFLCLNDKYTYKIFLDYIGNLTHTLKTDKLFAFYWEVTMSHDDLNYPMMMDEDYENLLSQWNDSGYLNKTVLILMSDHGLRWGDIRYTKQGRLEERLPFFFILTPPSFRDKYNKAYQNLKTNSHRLTTPFDIHATLMDLVDINKIDDQNIIQRSNKYYAQDKSISLFLPIPGNRTCKTVDVEDHWCTCNAEHKVDITSPEPQQAAAHMLTHINNLLKPHAECAHLALKEVVEATEMISGTPDDKEVGWKEYTIVVRTVPGDGVFEGTLRLSDTWTISGTVSRLNLYGEQSRCVHNHLLKLYCYCL